MLLIVKILVLIGGELKMRKQLNIKYELGHSYNKWYEKIDLHCPNCGEKNVFIEDDGGDYYVGETHYCLSCKATFYLPRLDVPENENDISWQDKQVFEGLISK
jgi:hypothetical protein